MQLPNFQQRQEMMMGDSKPEIVDKDPFDGSAEPMVYMSENRIPVVVELNETLIYIFFLAMVLAFLFIIPGVRRTKLTSLLGVLTLLTVGSSILLGINGSEWLVGSVQLTNVPYGALTTDTLDGGLEVMVGLSSVNVTLVGKLFGSSDIIDLDNNSTIGIKSVNYNERFLWTSPETMELEHSEALARGLPYPILTVTEFLSQDADGFNWARQLRQAGYHCSLALYAAFVGWCLMGIVMCMLPIYLPHIMQTTGILMMLSVWIYTISIGSPRGFNLQLGGQSLEFAFGYSAVMTFAAGALSMFSGLLILAIQITNPNEQITILDSERFMKDQRATSRMDIVNPFNGKALAIVPIYRNGQSDEVKKMPVFERSDSVIIPIGDIEEKFKIAASK